MTGLGFQVEEHKVPAPLVLAAGMKSVTNLIVRHRFGDGPVIALNAHGDVVPPGLGWDHDPYGAEVEDSKHGKVMYGRGVAVSKSDLATYAFALLALRDLAAREALRGTVELHLTYDEEVSGNLGPRWILENNLSKPDYAIAAGFSYNVVNAHNGCLHLETVVTGKQARAAQPGLRPRRARSGGRDPRRPLQVPAPPRPSEIEGAPASRRRRSTSAPSPAALRPTSCPTG